MAKIFPTSPEGATGPRDRKVFNRFVTARVENAEKIRQRAAWLAQTRRAGRAYPVAASSPPRGAADFYAWTVDRVCAYAP
eukprot:COSAG05_NODE_6773_length_905_cov_1.724566_1_plen_80_part_00